MLRFVLLFIFVINLPNSSFGQSVVLLGGSLKSDNVPVWTAMVQSAGGPGVAEIAVAGLNSTEGHSEAVRVADIFVREFGAKASFVVSLTETEVQDPLVADRIKKNSTGVFLVDSDDSALIQILRPNEDSLILNAIKQVLNNGGMVAGSSTVMGNAAVILGGDSMNALLMGTDLMKNFTGTTSPLIFSQTGGLGFLNGYVFDNNFSEKGREMRLIRTILETKNLPTIGTFKGIGVDENTALIVTNPTTNPVGKVVTATGSVSGVFFVDLTNVTDQSVATATYKNLPFSFLTVNDTIDLKTEVVTYASWKIPIAGEEWFEDAIPSADIFSQEKPAEWRQTNRRLIDCKEINVTCTSLSSIQPRFEVFFDRLPAVGFGADLPNDPAKTYIASFQNMHVSIKPI